MGKLERKTPTNERLILPFRIKPLSISKHQEGKGWIITDVPEI